MALVKTKPTSAGRRSMVKVVNADLHKGAPYAPLVEKQSQARGPQPHGQHHHAPPGRRPQAALSHRSISAATRTASRRRSSASSTTRTAAPTSRSSCYADGERRYMIAPKGLTVGQKIESGSEAPIKSGNALPLRNIPVGTTVHCVEMLPGKGAQIARAAGAGVQLLAREGEYAQLRMRSGEIRRVHVNCRATIGEVGNEEHNLRQIGKAGANRWRGIRPTVRGETMNPVDHPLGGRTRGNRHPVSPVGPARQGQEDPHQQAHAGDDRAQPPQEGVRDSHGTFNQERPVRRRASA